MSAVITGQAGTPMPRHRLIGADKPDTPIAFGPAGVIDAGRFMADVRAVSAALPDLRHAVNLCENRYHFLVAFCAVALRGQINLLPHSRAPEVVAEVLDRYPDSYSLVDMAHQPQPPRAHTLMLAPGTHRTHVLEVPELPAEQCVAIGFTSGSTSHPKPNPKHWGGFWQSTACNANLLLQLVRESGHDGSHASIVATVPPQHMYGMETSVLLPLLGPFSVHAGRPFFPADVANALAEARAPRVLVTTPVHLRALVASGVELPLLAGIVCATAPLPAALARAAETRFLTTVQEVFGSTETCVIAHRRTSHETAWTLYEGAGITPQPDGSLVSAPWLAQPVGLHDIVEMTSDRTFQLCGRHSDLLEIAGKRASVSDLTRRMLALEGVEDAVVFQPDSGPGDRIQRLAALVVAPHRSASSLLAELRGSVDPVFLPRPLKRVQALPRNETGKLPRAALLRALAGESIAGPSRVD